MSKRIISLQIDCEDETCGECSGHEKAAFPLVPEYAETCMIFQVRLDHNGNGDWKRCAYCKKAVVDK